MRLVGAQALEVAVSPKGDDGGGNNVASTVAAVADAVTPAEREGLLSACWRPMYAVASWRVMETPPMKMFKGSSGAGTLLKGEDMVAREGSDLGARWIWTNDQDLCHCRWMGGSWERDV